MTKSPARLVQPTPAHAGQIWECREEYLAAGSPMDGCATLSECRSAEAWLRRVENLDRAEMLPPHLLPTSQFLYVREEDERVLGMLELRRYLNEYYERFGGHVSFSVRPSERRQGHATAMLAQALEQARDIGLEELLLCCGADNEGARRVIVSNGGVLEDSVDAMDGSGKLERYWIDAGRQLSLKKQSAPGGRLE